MKAVLWSIALCCLLAGTAAAGTLTEGEADILRSEIATIYSAFERGDAEGIIRKTHPSLKKVFGGEDAFADVTRKAVDQLIESGLRIVSSETGMPTQTYPAGKEEVCFVPRTSVMELQGKKVRTTSFMIAIRKVGETEWLFLDGAGIAKQPELLYRLLPKLEQGVPLPPSSAELIEE
jgi:hypothetical protein